MPKMQSDNEVYTARKVYLGPPGFTLPFQWTYAQVGFTAGTTLSAGWLAGVVMNLPGWFVSCVMGATIFASSLIFKFIDAEWRIRDVLRTVLTDWRSITPARAQRTTEVRTTHIQISEGGRR